ncbi:MAG TPA: hypothetical protein VK933_02670 [Longimicrobiales bacterium]|nr:hypothetical protein [Longimicrobiales bacterium]
MPRVTESAAILTAKVPNSGGSTFSTTRRPGAISPAREYAAHAVTAQLALDAVNGTKLEREPFWTFGHQRRWYEEGAMRADELSQNRSVTQFVTGGLQGARV